MTTEPNHRQNSDPVDKQLHGAAADPERTLRLLGDQEARRILLATDDAKTVAQLTEELELSESTAYRKIKALVEEGLLERVNPHAASRTPTRYRRRVEGVTVDFTPELRIDYHMQPD